MLSRKNGRSCCRSIRVYLLRLCWTNLPASIWLGNHNMKGLQNHSKTLEPLCANYVKTIIDAGIAELRCRAIRKLQGILAKTGRAQYTSDEINRDDRWMQSITRQDFPEDLDWIAKSHLQLLHDANLFPRKVVPVNTEHSVPQLQWRLTASPSQTFLPMHGKLELS